MLNTKDQAHHQNVKSISEQVQQHVKDGKKVRTAKGGVSHFVPLPNDLRRKKQNAIDVSMLNRVLEIDVEQKLCLAEPGVTFEALVNETLKHGLIPMVVPELKGITVGGAVAGCSVESMSYKYGGFHDSCVEYELISGTGEVLNCSRQNESLAFEMVHGSYGTLGILSAIRFKLVPAKKFVRMQYERFDNFGAYQKALHENCNKPEVDFIDGIIHSPTHLVLCLGFFADTAPYISDYSWLEIYYKSTAKRTEDYLTTQDYCFRYDTECHWLTRTIPLLESKPVRFALGPFLLGSTNLIKWSKRLEKVLQFKRRPDVVCDVFIPSKRFGEFFDWYKKEFDFFPLWIVPYRVPQMYGWVEQSRAERMKDDLLIDCAVYGKQNNLEHIDFSEVLEKKTFELDGVKTLISRNHYSKDEFWQVYNRENYEMAKSRLDPKGSFPGLYEKFHA